MASLYEIRTDYATLLTMYDSAETDEAREQYLELMATADDAIDEKAEIYAKIIRNKQAEAEAYKAEAERLTAKRKSAERVIERMKEALLDVMIVAEKPEISTTIGKWKIQKNPIKCEVLNIDAIPAEYHIPQPDKVDVKAMIAQHKLTGEVFDGCEFKQEEGIRFR